MTPFERIEADLVAGVDNHVGDTLSVTFKNGTTRDVVGYVWNDGDEPGAESINPIRIIWHGKIAKANLPEGLGEVRSITSRRLVGPHRPGPDTQDSSGVDFIFDLQKARGL